MQISKAHNQAKGLTPLLLAPLLSPGIPHAGNRLLPLSLK